jgi:hypothetical protein
VEEQFGKVLREKTRWQRTASTLSSLPLMLSSETLDVEQREFN